MSVDVFMSKLSKNLSHNFICHFFFFLTRLHRIWRKENSIKILFRQLRRMSRKNRTSMDLINIDDNEWFSFFKLKKEILMRKLL